MSEIQVEVMATKMPEENASIIKESVNEEKLIGNEKDEENQVDEDEDLEDGEIDDDDDEDDDVTVTAVYAVNKENDTKKIPLAVIDLSLDNTSSPPPKPVVPKSKKPQPLLDDHASSIENALAKALKKRGIDPVPKVVEPAEHKEETNLTESRNSRRRKRRRQKERENKERKEKKRRTDSPETAPMMDEEDMDEFEMLNVRGGSPPPMPLTKPFNAFKSNYESSDDTESSYDSYDSADTAANNEKKRQRNSPQKDTRKRRDRGRREKRSRRDSLDEKHRQEPRKLELCKFYLMECCAKRDKCSYMHSDFPCKYYYLGMDCAKGSDCKFAHGEPLNEQLRNILIKHIETAPKEILGNFKRVSRENAFQQMCKRHEELCNKFGVENNWSTTLSTGGGNRQQQQQQQQQKHQNQQQQQHVNIPNKIPSLLDMVINPPPEVVVQKQSEKQRKSRWADTRSIEKENKSNVPDYMDLNNLKGVLSDDHIDKLTQMGIKNLEQVNQLTFGQLNQIGLTIAEISEIQAKLQGNKTQTTTTTAEISDCDKNATTTTTIKAIETDNETNKNIQNSNTEEDKESTDESSNNNKIGSTNTFDYSQYLRDSNLAFDRYESYEDEKDDEQLVIDDDNMDNENENLKQSAQEKNNENGLFNPFANYDRTDVDLRLQRDRTYSRSHSRSRSRSRSPSHTPTRAQSSTPEASDSLDADEDAGQPKYERSTIYDFNAIIAAQEEEEAAEKSAINDFNSELPFKPIMNYKPATEIDGSITSHLPMTWKVSIVDLPRPNYLGLRKNSNKSMEQIIDPRLRRILGMPDLRYTLPSPSSRGVRRLSNNIASPDSEEASPKYYIPPSSNPYNDERKASQLQKTISSSSSSIVTTTTTSTTATTTTTAAVEPRLTDPRARKDPRRAAAAAAAQARPAVEESASNASADGMNAATKQNVEIRNLLHKSEWYKNLNSKFKIMVNQQLALVSTELKKFHQNPSPQKIFDISFILNNTTLQQILTQLGIYIDENGEVAHIDGDSEDKSQQQEQANLRSGNEAQISLPNLSQPPPDFLRAPLPNLAAPPPNLSNTLQTLPPPQLFRPPLNIAQFGVLNAVGRPSLLGMPPAASNAANNAFNHPFAAELANALPAAAFAQGLLAPFNNFAGGPQGAAGLMLANNMRNFNNNNSNGQRNNNRNRRNKI